MGNPYVFVKHVFCPVKLVTSGVLDRGRKDLKSTPSLLFLLLGEVGEQA